MILSRRSAAEDRPRPARRRGPRAIPAPAGGQPAGQPDGMRPSRPRHHPTLGPAADWPSGRIRSRRPAGATARPRGSLGRTRRTAPTPHCGSASGHASRARPLDTRSGVHASGAPPPPGSCDRRPVRAQPEKGRGSQRWTSTRRSTGRRSVRDHTSEPVDEETDVGSYRRRRACAERDERPAVGVHRRARAGTSSGRVSRRPRRPTCSRRLLLGPRPTATALRARGSLTSTSSITHRFSS